MATYISNNEMDQLLDFWGVTYGEHKKLLFFLIKTTDELSEFMQQFYEGDIIKNMIMYQRFRRIKFAINVEAYSSMYAVNDISATETIFQEPLNRTDMNLLSKYDISHVELYNRLQENPVGSYLELVRTSGMIKRTYSDNFLINF